MIHASFWKDLVVPTLRLLNAGIRRQTFDKLLQRLTNFQRWAWTWIWKFCEILDLFFYLGRCTSGSVQQHGNHSSGRGLWNFEIGLKYKDTLNLCCRLNFFLCPPQWYLIWIRTLPLSKWWCQSAYSDVSAYPPARDDVIGHAVKTVNADNAARFWIYYSLPW